MNLLILILIFIPLFSSPVSAQEFDLPEVIGFIIEPPEAEEDIGSAFCWVGDQNDDGYDDLLVSHDPYLIYEDNREYYNRVELFYGGEEMDAEPDMLFELDEEGIGFGATVNYLGSIVEGRNDFFSIYSYVWLGRRLAHRSKLFFYEGFDELDNDMDFEISHYSGENTTSPGPGHRSRPADLNGDGFDDLIAAQRIDSVSHFVMYFGGEEFDSIPDWAAINPTIQMPGSGLFVSTGYDINSDGYDDALIAVLRMMPDRYYRRHYSMFLGGDPPDTIPMFEFGENHFEGLRMYNGFSLLPDVNGDGYDDWGIHVIEDAHRRDGYYVFYGSEEPDMDNFILLEGNQGMMANYEADISGGDFNGDGYGDIVAGMRGANFADGSIHIYFGRPQMRREMDIDINGPDDYGLNYHGMGRQFGAIGDYNGDGVDDFVARIRGRAHGVAIFAGNSRWRVNSVSTDLPEQFHLSFEAIPNPFNAEAKLSVSLPYAGNVKLTVYDVYGRLVATVADSLLSDGRHDFMLNGGQLSSGVYFARLVFEGGGRRDSDIKKLVCLK